MKKEWPKVRLGGVLRPVTREESVDALREYRLLGVRLDGKGPFLRETVSGTQTSATKLHRVAEGDFIYSRLFACRGAFGVIEHHLDGCHVSGEFPTFTPVPGRIDVNFLNYWFRLPTTIARVNEDCTGSTPLTRNRFKEQFFLALEIPLPSLEEQRRMVAHIEKLAVQIYEARSLRQQAKEEAGSLLICMAHRRDLSVAAKESAGWKKRRLGECIRLVDDSQRVVAGQSYQNLGIYSFGRGLFSKPPIDGTVTSATTLRRVKTGQFIYSRLFAFEGAYGMVTKEYDGHFVSGEYPTFECDPGAIRVEFVAAYFKAPSAWREVGVGSKGLGHRRQRVQPREVLAHSIWVPPLWWQDRLGEVQAEADALKRLEADTAAELDALLPAILDRAFKGDLRRQRHGDGRRADAVSPTTTLTS